MAVNEFGTDVWKLYRSCDPETSREAAESIETSNLEWMVFETVLSFGPQGCISDEVRAKHPGYSYSSITARFAALIDKCLLFDTGRRRPGKSGRNQRVLCAFCYGDCDRDQEL
jgi:hypothetical protein